MRRECRKHFPRQWLQMKPLVSDPGMHHGTCVTHVPWCMSGSLTRGGGKKTFPAFPVHAQPAIIRIWQEAHGTSIHHLPLDCQHTGTVMQNFNYSFEAKKSFWINSLVAITRRHNIYMTFTKSYIKKLRKIVITYTSVKTRTVKVDIPLPWNM